MPENGTLHISMMKSWVSHILFLRKMGLIVYMAALKRGLFGPHIRTMSYGSYPPSELFTAAFTCYFFHRSVMSDIVYYNRRIIKFLVSCDQPYAPLRPPRKIY